MSLSDMSIEELGARADQFRKTCEEPMPPYLALFVELASRLPRWRSEPPSTDWVWVRNRDREQEDGLIVNSIMSRPKAMDLARLWPNTYEYAPVMEPLGGGDG